MQIPKKDDLIKISDYIWEIPKDFRSDMRVPARVFASEEMLSDLFKDRSLWQLVNLTTLPGVSQFAVAMPDIHEGYGSPIGGVVGFDSEEGIISPGMCVEGNTKILTPLGFYLPIKDFASNICAVSVLDQKNKKLTKALPIKFFKILNNPSILEITTSAGYKIQATKDHPFLTKNGMIKAEELKAGDFIAMIPFEGVLYQKPKEKILVDEKKLYQTWLKLNQNPDAHGFQQIKNRLKKLNLLPLKTTSEKFPYLLKIAGYLLGDGTIYFGQKKKAGRLSFYGKKEDLIQIKEDLEKIGFNAYLTQRKRKYVIKTTYKNYHFKRIEYSLNLHSSSFALLLWSLGFPIGNKSKNSFVLPEFLFDLPLWQKRLFLASFFGAELSSPKTYKQHPFNFYPPILSVNTRENNLKQALKFLQQIRNLLKEFDVQVIKISQRKEQINKDGSQSIRLRLIISSRPQNLINLWSKIGFEYHQEKAFQAMSAVLYLRKKLHCKEAKFKLQGIRSRNGQVVWQKLTKKEREMYLTDAKKSPRLHQNQFISFTEFLNQCQQEGFFDEITKITVEPFKDYVYDFTVLDQNHNFIANNFVVSNCGYDINCGVRLLVSPFFHQEIQEKIPKLTQEIYQQVPSGVGRGGFWKLNQAEMKNVLEKGAEWLLEIGYAEKEDLEHTEENGKLEGADSNLVSEQAKRRGRDQLGTIGAGNHFVEIQKVQEIYDSKIAQKLNLEKGRVNVMIHCGSRGLGHQIATDYIRKALKYLQKHQIGLVDRELAYFPLSSEEAREYFSAMKAGANFAWANRQLIAWEIRKAFQKVFGQRIDLKQIYDLSHNIVKSEEYFGKKLFVHRKGATRSFPKGHPLLSGIFQEIGQPVLIPGSMGTASFVLVGSDNSLKLSFGSSCHGAGRLMSRAEAKRKIRGSELKRVLEQRGVSVSAGSMSGLAEEAPEAYKNVLQVVEVVHQLGLAEKVAKLVPLGVIKG